MACMTMRYPEDMIGQVRTNPLAVLHPQHPTAHLTAPPAPRFRYRTHSRKIRLGASPP